MRDAGQVLGIEMLDHVVLSDTGYVSLRDRGWVR
jgi:DNA repair protein RadC